MKPRPRVSPPMPRCVRHGTVYVGHPPMCPDCKREALAAQAASRRPAE